MKVESIPGMWAKKAAALKAAGLHTADDVLEHFPRDYDDRTNVKPINELSVGAVNTLRGRVDSEPVLCTVSKKSGGKNLDMVKCLIKDGTGRLEIVWFNQPYLAGSIKPGDEYIFTGKVQEMWGGAARQRGVSLQMSQPDFERAKEVNLTGGRIVPIYTVPKQYTQKGFRALVYWLLENCAGARAFEEALPAALLEKHGLCGRKAAIRNIHFPESDGMFMAARRRLVFEELFVLNMTLRSIRKASAGMGGRKLGLCEEDLFARMLPFPLTGAQRRAISEISRDLQSGQKMNRLVQGDVGSGKTAVAMAAAFFAARSGTQAAFMAPTEVLAAQVHKGFCEILGGLSELSAPPGTSGIGIALLTGSLGARARRAALAKIEDGTAQITVGTHALIQKGVSFKNLGLVVTDEQHRFGVNQRLTLGQKGLAPHTLVMSATPIPRTLGLILHGDLDISTIDELPPGRKPVRTYSVRSRYRPRIREFIRKEAEAGRQAYVICPAIDEPENPDYKAQLSNVKKYTATLREALPTLAIALLHGQMKPAEKERVMADFKENRVQVLVSTTVIEVGVNVPNASVMVIENAERFGLSQLHQLRGRVGRGGDESYCILVTDSGQQHTVQRMKAITGTNDGFRLSEMDLMLRGGGDFFGTRQHGLPNFKIANLYRDIETLKEAGEAAQSGAYDGDTALALKLRETAEKAHGGVI